MTKLQDWRITQRTVYRLPARDKDVVFWDRDVPGFGVRVYPSGSQVYVVQCRSHRKLKWIMLGRHGLITVEQFPGKVTIVSFNRRQDGRIGAAKGTVVLWQKQTRRP